MKHNQTDAKLFSPTTIRGLELKNRIAMAPMTRSRAQADGTPTAIMAEYYEQRSGAGLIVSEGVSISPVAQGFLNVPGIFNDAHVAAWKPVTERVHARGGKFVLQLWHVGRIGHSSNMAPGLSPVGPSAIAHDRSVVTPSGMQPAPVPKALSAEEVQSTINDYALAAKRAVAAGCDGIEIHAANGYLPGQFLHETTNVREDQWGGSIEKRARFLIEAAKACVAAVGAERVGVRLSPFSVFNGATSRDEAAVYQYLIPELDKLQLLYLHVVTAEVAGNQTVTRTGDEEVPDVVGFSRALWSGPLIAAGGYTAGTAEAELEANRADVVAFGRDFIGNPDLPDRLAKGYPLVERRPTDWYGSTGKGYTDYPPADEASEILSN